MNAVKEDVMRMANASFYVGRGEYDLFVRTSDDELVNVKYSWAIPTLNMWKW